MKLENRGREKRYSALPVREARPRRREFDPGLGSPNGGNNEPGPVIENTPGLPTSTGRPTTVHRIKRDFGGFVEEYKARYGNWRDNGDKVVVDGICNSACTLATGIIKPENICATPQASLGVHAAYFDTRWTAGVKVTSIAGTAELMSVYPQSVKDWIARNGGLTPDMKKIKGDDLNNIVQPCSPEVSNGASGPWPSPPPSSLKLPEFSRFRKKEPSSSTPPGKEAGAVRVPRQQSAIPPAH